MFRHSNSAARVIMALAAVIFVVPTVMPAAGISLQDFSDSFENVSKKVTPAVVQIYTTGYGPAQGSGVAPITIQRGTYDSLQSVLNIPAVLVAPVAQGQPLAELKVSLNGTELVSEPLRALSDNPDGSIWQRTRDGVSLWFE